MLFTGLKKLKLLANKISLAYFFCQYLITVLIFSLETAQSMVTFKQLRFKVTPTDFR